MSFIRLGFNKVAWFLWPRFERESIKEMYKLPAKPATIVSGILGLSSAVLMIGGVVGFIFAKRDWLWCISTVLIAYTVFVTFVVYGSPRYRDAVDYLLLIFLALGAARSRAIWAELRINGPSVRKPLWVVVPVLAYIFLSWMWVAYDLSRSGH